MARPMGMGETTAYTNVELSRSLSDTNQPDLSGPHTTMIIPNTKVLLATFKKVRGTIAAIAILNRENIQAGNHEFEINSRKFRNQSAIYWLSGALKLGDEIFHHIFIGIGDHVALRGYMDAAAGFNHIEFLLNHVELKALIPDVVPTLAMETISTPTPHAYTTSESGLFNILNSPGDERETKIITTLLFLFPYIKPLIQGFVQIITYNQPTSLADPASTTGFASRPTTSSAEQLGLLALFTLGPAYSLDAKLNEQIGRRVKAAAASMQLDTLSFSEMGGLIQRVGWKAGDISPIVDDVLAAAICIREDMTSDPEGTLDSFASGIWLKQHGHINDVALEILEQARLVYRNYHSTSLSFVPAVISEIRQTFGETGHTFQEELERFTRIKPKVLNCPYMGLRSKLPEQYHIKNFPKLVYCALKYHEKSLEEPAEQTAFRQYKVAEISNHITNPVEKKIVEDCSRQLPLPSIAALTQLVKVLPLQLAQNLMDRKTEAEQKEVLMSLRADPNKGSWAETLIAQEDAELQKKMIREAVALLTESIKINYEVARDKLELIMDATRRRNQQGALMDWRDRMTARVGELQPWEDTITEARSDSQRIIRNQLIINMRNIMDSIRQPPQPMDE